MQEKQRAFLVRTAYWAVWTALLWLGVRYLLRWLLPFLLALGLAALVEPVIAWCRRRMGLKRGFTAAVVTIAVTAAILALASSYLDKPIGNHVAAIGEVGLTGELRSVNHLSERLSEVHRLGFETCIIPKQRKDQIRAPQGLALIEACNIAEALRAIVQA